MVETRTVAIVGLVIVLLSMGMDWVMGPIESTFLSLPSVMTSSPSDDSTFEGWATNILVPYLSSPGQLLAIALSIGGFLAGVVAVIRWKYMWVAGSLGLVGGSLWTIGIYSIPSKVAAQLCSWPGYAGLQVSCGSPALQTGPGPYAMILGGGIMLTGYLLSRKGILEVPAD
ncbi:MAG: hypothetical protein ABSG92_09560 [Conexivisphaerales archaeon]|jgi:hypothetical protein